MSLDPGTDPATYLETLLGEVCFGDQDTHPLEETIDRYFTPDYQQRTDGELTSRDGFAEHIRAVRSLAVSGTVKVRDVVREGNRIADRHEVTITKRDGNTSRIEVYLFGEFAADGRLRRVEEISRLLAGHESDATLARTR